MDLGKRVKERRLELNMTLEEVAEKVGVTKSTVLKWENGMIGNMRSDKISLLADALKVSPLWIMGIEETEQEIEKSPEVVKETTSELYEYFNYNKEKLDTLSKDKQEKLIKLIDLYLE